MSKTPSKKLYLLVHSLSSAERRYLKVLANNPTKQYVRLLDLIEAQAQEYNEDKLIEALYPNEKPQSRKFSELKNYLYEFILRGLQQYDLEGSQLQRISEQLVQVRVLFKRAQYEACLELIEKTQQSALQYDDLLSQVECLRWIRQIAYARMDIEFFNKSLDKLDEDERLLLLQLENLSAYKNLFFKLYISIRTNAFVRSEDKIAYLRDIIATPLMADPSNAQTFTAQVIYYRVLNLYHYSMLAMDEFRNSGRQVLSIMEQRPHIFQEDASEYISALSNYTLSCGLTEDYDEVRASLEKFRLIRTRTIDDQIKIHLLYYSYYFSLCIYTGDFQTGQQILEEHFTESRKFENNKLFERGSLYFYYCYIYLGNGNYETALDWLNKWLSLPRGLERQDLQSLARIINLIIHYEMGNSLLLDSLVRSTQRYLLKRERLLEFERSILQFVKEVQRLNDRKAWLGAFEKLKVQLENLEDKPAENAMLRYFDIIAWLESKISRRVFADVVKERHQKRQELKKRNATQEENQLQP